jgi:acetoin utilization protein AcuB
MFKRLLHSFKLRDLKVKDCMTCNPISFRSTTHVFAAKKRMAEAGIRHIPVVDGHELIGIVTERDLHLYEGVYKDKDFDREVTLAELCLFEPYAVDEDTRLSKVLRVMREHKYGSILITKDGKLSGILTLVDVCRVLEESLS